MFVTTLLDEFKTNDSNIEGCKLHLRKRVLELVL